MTSRSYAAAAVAALALAVAGVAGYRLGTGHWPTLADALHHDHGETTAMAPAASTERKPIYYRNPMGLADTSPVPKKDQMGMDYIPVYADEEKGSAGTVKISLDRVQRSGVRTEKAQMRRLVRPVRAAGVAKPDERTMYSVTLRADAFIAEIVAVK